MEKDRRNQMKNLYSELNSLVPQDPSSFPRAIPDQIDDATNYIRQLQDNIKNLSMTRDELQGSAGGYNANRGSYSTNSPVQIEVTENGNALELEVTVLTGLECQFVFTEALRILHEENAEVVNVNYSVAENIVFHTIHAQMGEAASSNAVARITQRLKNFEL
ncbi:LOW QUALITY PROTEIN: transcription factor bHLH162-like [Spinacia oleracea]|uniref:LOW QUALITY PROTEIN: transcription factor bHLH162-like n=1 Tax=Spinacia oleracea TaxID=3562 RepID=A0A9R0J683_SPIOL|nr:LOW QUALITY PROTEIN: transcription factor bHLH162-like [Spinacia oleracea]